MAHWKLPLSLSQADSRNFYFGSSSATPWCNDLSHKNHVRSENKIALQHRKIPTEYKVRKMCNECINVWVCVCVSLASIHTQIHTHTDALSFSLPVAFPFLLSLSLFISE